MARQARASLAHQVVLVAQRGHNSGAIFVSDSDRQEYLDLLQQHAKSHQTNVYGYALLESESLLVLSGETDSAVARFMQQIGRSYVRRFNLRQNRSGALFEGRYRAACLQPERFLLDVLLWLDAAAVRHSLCQEPQAWAFGSCTHYLGIENSRVITLHPALYALGNTPYAREQNYGQALQEGLSEAKALYIKQNLYRNYALGDAAFIAELEEKTGKRLQAGQRGRPRKSNL